MLRFLRIRPPLLNGLLSLLGVAAMAGSIQLGFGTLQTPGPGFFPFLCGIIIFVPSMGLLLTPPKAGEGPPFQRYELKNFVAMTLIFLAWIVLMPLVGYLVVTFAAALSSAKILRLEGWRKPIALAAGITVFCFVLFDVYLYTDLPRGFFELRG